MMISPNWYRARTSVGGEEAQGGLGRFQLVSTDDGCTLVNAREIAVHCDSAIRRDPILRADKK